MQAKFIFTDTKNGASNFRKLDIKFVNDFNRFLLKIHCTEIQINSSFRDTGASHKFGRAIDIDHLIANGKQYNFDFRYGKDYSDYRDEEFYNICKNYFGDRLFQYYSPAIIKHANQRDKKNNRLRFTNNKFAMWEKNKRDMQIKPDKRDVDQQHINHLHLSVDFDDQKLVKNYGLLFGNSAPVVQTKCPSTANPVTGDLPIRHAIDFSGIVNSDSIIIPDRLKQYREFIFNSKRKRISFLTARNSACKGSYLRTNWLYFKKSPSQLPYFSLDPNIHEFNRIFTEANKKQDFSKISTYDFLDKGDEKAGIYHSLNKLKRTAEDIPNKLPHFFAFATAGIGLYFAYPFILTALSKKKKSD